jgi:hypothetical protein
MVPVRPRAFLATLLACILAVTGSSCGDGGDRQPPQDEEPPAFGACTGAVPENATACPGTSTGLTADAPRVVMALCQTTPCSYICNTGFLLLGGGCVPASPPEAVSFVDNGDGTVTMTDSYGTLVWLRNANCLEPVAGVDRSAGPVIWSQAQAWSTGLASGACGLTDGSVPGDWGLPVVSELLYLSSDLAVAGDPARALFAGIQESAYWADFSTCVGYQGAVDVRTGQNQDMQEDSRFNVWPVRRAVP